MTEPGVLNLLCPQGATFTTQLTWKTDTTPVDLTNYTARMQVRSSWSSDTKIADLTTANGGITLGGTAGTILITITATATAAMPAGVAVYDLELVAGSGTVTRLVQGNFTITPEVTR